MQERSVIERVEILERTVLALETLPARVTAVELHLVQLLEEMRAEFSATREQLRAEIRAGDEETRRFVRVLHEQVITRIATIQEAGRSRRKR